MNYGTRFIKSIPALLLSILIAGCGGGRPADSQSGPLRQYQLRGRVETVDLSRKRVLLDHREIPGYMDAMKMEFSIPDEKALSGLKSGDEVTARLLYDTRTNLSWLEDVAVVGHSQ